MMPFLKGCKMMFVLAALLCCRQVAAAVYPAEGATTTCLRIPFTAADVPGVASYVFHIAISRYDNSKVFDRNIKLKGTSKSNTMILQVPLFNKEYSWRVNYYDSTGKKIGKSGIYHFNTGPGKVDSTVERHRIRVLTNKYPDPSLMFLLDYANTLCSLDGKEIWHLPDSINGMKVNEQKRDINLTNAHTLTFLIGSSWFEMNYFGDLVGSSLMSDPGRTSMCHHECERLKKGSYMALTNDAQDRKIADVNGKKGDSTIRSVTFGNVVEFNASGKIWEWKAADYFTDDEVRNQKMMDNNFEFPMHMNAFYFDEARSFVYVGFRNLNKIIKIKYPEKRVVAVYDGAANEGNGHVFQRQHSISMNKAGELCIFNNNSGGRGNTMGMNESQIETEDSIPTLLVLKEVENGASPGYEKVWEFDCRELKNEGPLTVTNGGNMLELADGNYFACLGSAPRIIIVSKNKEVLYDAIIERWDLSAGKWLPFPQYRAFPIYSREFDEIIMASKRK